MVYNYLINMQTDTLENSLDLSKSSNNSSNSSNSSSSYQQQLQQQQQQNLELNNLELKCEKRSRISSKDSNSIISSKKHSCNICSKIFLGLSDLRRHLRVHSGERPYECDYCKKKFRQSISLRNHIACIHKKDNKFLCDYCDKTFPIKERLRLHLRKHTGEKPYSCTFCNKKFARGGQLKQHLPSHSGEKKNFCKQCNASFTTKSNLFMHRKKMHFKKFLNSSTNNDDDNNDLNNCRMCSKHFNTLEGLKKHSLTCHRHIKQFFCTICNKTLKGHLQQHLNVHDNIKLYTCNMCGTKFAQKSQLNVHERVHTGERPFVCKVCGQSFSHSYVLKTHYRKHTGEKPFKCSICSNDVAFAQLPHLKTHMRSIHGKDKTYMCDGCQEFFKMKNELQLHLGKCTKYKLNNELKTTNDKIIIEDQNLLTDIRLNVVIILKKISSKERLQKLGVEKRLIDNVILTALKHAGKSYHDNPNLNEIDRLKMNIQEFLEWTLPKTIMETFKEEKQSIEEIIEHLATGYCKSEKSEKEKK